MLSDSSDIPDDDRSFFAKILDFAPGLVVKMQWIFTTMQNPESIDVVIASARKRGYFDDGGDMFLLLAHRFQSMTEEVKRPQNTLALDGLSDDTLRILGTSRAEVQVLIESWIIQWCQSSLRQARSVSSEEEERIPGQPRWLLEEEVAMLLGEIGRLGYDVSSIENISKDVVKKLGTSIEELRLLRKIGKIHRAAWLIKQARQDDYLLSDDWEGLMTYLSDAQWTSDALRLEYISDETLALAGLTRAELQGWFRHVPG